MRAPERGAERGEGRWGLAGLCSRWGACSKHATAWLFAGLPAFPPNVCWGAVVICRRRWVRKAAFFLFSELTLIPV